MTESGQIPVLEGLRSIARGETRDVVTAALLVAQIDDGMVDSEFVRARIAELSARFQPAADALLDQHAQRGDAAAAANALAEALCTQLHDDAGLTGEVGDYYNPGNSRIDAVLHSGTGIPISLGVIYLAVARAAGITLHAVNFPAHLLLCLQVDDAAVFIDPFAGVLLGIAECQQRLQAIYGEPVPLAPEHLQPMSVAHLVLRMLNNLKAIRLGREELEWALEISDLILVVAPDYTPEIQQRADLLERLGSFEAAVVEWQKLLPLAGSDERRQLIEARIQRLRRE